MTIKVAINGFGRIGRNVMRALYESGKRKDIEIVAINCRGEAKNHAHLFKNDTAHGRFSGEVEIDGESIIVNGGKGVNLEWAWVKEIFHSFQVFFQHNVHFLVNVFVGEHHNNLKKQ